MPDKVRFYTYFHLMLKPCLLHRVVEIEGETVQIMSSRSHKIQNKEARSDPV